MVPGAGLEPARTLPGPRDFKSRVSTNTQAALSQCLGLHFSAEYHMVPTPVS